jgi:hypothetical protein
MHQHAHMAAAPAALAGSHAVCLVPLLPDLHQQCRLLLIHLIASLSLQVSPLDWQRLEHRDCPLVCWLHARGRLEAELQRLLTLGLRPGRHVAQGARQVLVAHPCLLACPGHALHVHAPCV